MNMSARKQCPQKNDWKAWNEDKKSDRLFMICPACKTYGSHIEETN